MVFRDAWKINASDSDFTRFVDLLKNHKDVKSIKILQRKENNFIILTDVIQHNSTFETIINSGCIFSSPPSLKNGYEFFDLIVPDSQSKIKILKEMEEIGELKVIKIGKYEEDSFGLTSKQDMALKTAIANDYYSWPKRVTLGQLAEKLNISRSVYEEHLRKAESKILPNINKTILGKTLKPPHMCGKP